MKSSLGWAALMLLASTLVAEPPPPTQIEARLRFVSLDSPILDHSYVTDGKLTPVVIATGSLTSELHYHGPAKLELFKNTEDAAPKTGIAEASRQKKTETRPPTWWTTLPSEKGIQHLILLVTQPSANGGIIAMPEDAAAFAFGTHRYMNFCPYPINVKVASGAFQIPSQSFKTFRSGVKHGTYYNLEIRSQENGEEKLGYSTRVLQNDGFRKIYIILPGPPNSGRVRLKVIEDQPPSRSAPQAKEVPEPKGK
jgi:hypothetical protein